MWNTTIRTLSHFLIGLGVGVAAHDFILESINPYRMPPHGFWFGITFIIIGWLGLSVNEIKWIYKRLRGVK